MTRIDLDNNATTPIEPEVRAAMVVAMRDLPGNPSSLHSVGRRARDAVECARESVARLVRARAEEIVFTSGGTEANNLALVGTLSRPGGRLVTSSIEHPSVLVSSSFLESRGVVVSRVDPDPTGVIRSGDMIAALVEGAGLVSLMTANNETGALQPVREVAVEARKRGVPVHTDAVQAIGKIPIDAEDLGADLLTLSAHKIGGPKGIGALWARRGVFPSPIVHGGGQERGNRSGTENVIGIVGFGKAAELAAVRVKDYGQTVSRLRDLLEAGIVKGGVGGVAIGAESPRVPNTTDIAFEGIEGGALVQLLDLKGIAASTGSACEAGSEEYSHVLRAMAIPEELARGAIRFSLSFHTVESEIAEAIGRVIEAVEEIRGL
ncbi:MAG: cysteine desulfurase family protein [Candidatus Eisenbacteria bacterium]